MKVWSFVLALLCAPLPAAAAKLPSVLYTVEGAVGSWQPINAADVARAIEETSLEVLTRPGLVQLTRRNKRAQEPQRADYSLEIKGRILDEAETFTVYLSFGAGEKSDLPSFNASETVSLSRASRAAVLQKVEDAARRAAKGLLAALEPSLRRAAKGGAPPRGEAFTGKEQLPWQWSEVKVPSLKLSAGSADLYAKSQKEQRAALRVYTSLALLDDPGARTGLEGCVLKHPSEDLRHGCLVALRPAARTSPPAQRVVIEAFRKDESSKVRQEASEQMTYFSGFARSEAIQAWVEAAASCKSTGPLDQLGDLPNLDLAIHRCLIACGKKPKYQRSKRACIELLPPLPHARRKAILWKFLEELDPDSPYYLEGAGESENSTGTDWQWAVDSVLEKETRWDPALEEILWKRYQRSLSHVAIETLAEWGAPSERLVNRLLEALQTGGHRSLVHGLQRIGERDPALAPKISEAVAELMHTGAYPKTVRKEALQSLLDRLKKVTQ